MHQCRITGASGRGISGYYNLDRGQVEWVRKLWRPQEEGVPLNYYITQCTGNSISWGSDEFERRCGRENQHPERLGPQAFGWGRRTGKKIQLVANRVRVNMLQFCSVSNSLSHTTLSIKWEVYFSKKTVSLVFIMSLLWCLYVYVFV